MGSSTPSLGGKGDAEGGDHEDEKGPSAIDLHLPLLQGPLHKAPLRDRIVSDEEEGEPPLPRSGWAGNPCRRDKEEENKPVNSENSIYSFIEKRISNIPRIIRRIPNIGPIWIKDGI